MNKVDIHLAKTLKYPLIKNNFCLAKMSVFIAKQAIKVKKKNHNFNINEWLKQSILLWT